MQVEFEQNGDLCVLRLSGRFATGRDSNYLRTKSDELKSTGLSKIIADFTNVEYIDSTGIGFLIAIYTSILRNPLGRFVLANPNNRVRQVLELTRLTHVMPIYSSVETASEALRQPQATKQAS
jgi:anti-anti-sigma factor